MSLLLPLLFYSFSARLLARYMATRCRTWIARSPMGFLPAPGRFPPRFDLVAGFDFVTGLISVTASTAFFARSTFGSVANLGHWPRPQCASPQIGHIGAFIGGPQNNADMGAGAEAQSMLGPWPH